MIGGNERGRVEERPDGGKIEGGIYLEKEGCDEGVGATSLGNVHRKKCNVAVQCASWQLLNEGSWKVLLSSAVPLSNIFLLAAFSQVRKLCT